jgi:hypothetical protein
MIVSLVQPQVNPWSPNGALFSLWYHALYRPINQLRRHTQLLVTAIQLESNLLQANSPDQGCVSGAAAKGGAIGTAAGLIVGGVAGLETGPGAVATAYAGGALLGPPSAAVGYVGGLFTCMSSTGPGGGDGAGGKVQTGQNDSELNAGNLKTLNRFEIDKLKAAGEDAEQIKKEIVGPRGSQYDLYKTENGDIVVKAKNGIGEAQPTGLNIKNF